MRTTPYVEALAADMNRFAELLKLVGRPGPETGRQYAEYAAALLADPSPRAVEVVREWVSLTLQYSGNGSIFDRYVSVDGVVDDALTAEYLRLAGKLREFGVAPRVIAQPRGELIPKVPNMNLFIPLVVVPIIAMVFTGIAMDNSAGTAANLLLLLFMVLLLVEVAGLVILLKVGFSAKRKLAAAGDRIAHSLAQEHGLTVESPARLIENQGKSRLSRYELRAVDANRRPVYVTVGTDETGTRAVPVSVRPIPEAEL